MMTPRLAPVLWLVGALACATTSTSGESLTPTPTNVTEFHVSVFNACTDDVTLQVGATPESGRKVLLFKTSRDSFAGTTEAVWLLDEKEAPIALYQPIQGNQKIRVTADCTGLAREP